MAAPIDNHTSSQEEEDDPSSDFTDDEEAIVSVTELQILQMDLWVYLRQSQKIIDFGTQHPDLKFSADVIKSFKEMQEHIEVLNNMFDEMLQGVTLDDSSEVLSNIRSFRDLNTHNFTNVARDVVDSFGYFIARVRNRLNGPSE